MATDGRNFLSELFKSAGQGLGTYAAGRQQEQAEDKQNALAAFAAAMQMQEANRQAEEHRANMAKLAMQNRILELQEQERARLMALPAPERAAEEGQSNAARKAAELKSWIDANNVPIGPWNASPAGMAGAIDQSGIFGPGMSGEIGGITFKGADPDAELNRRYKEAMIDAMRGKAAGGPSTTAKVGAGIRVWAEQLQQAQKAVQSAQESYDEVSSPVVAQALGYGVDEISRRAATLEAAKQQRDALLEKSTDTIGSLVGQLFDGGAAPADGEQPEGDLSLDDIESYLKGIIEGATTGQ